MVFSTANSEGRQLTRAIIRWSSVLNLYRSNLKRYTDDEEGVKIKFYFYEKRVGVKHAGGFGWECLHCGKFYITGYGKEYMYLSTSTYCVHTFFTRTVLQSSKDILFKTLIVLFQFGFILYLDKQLHEVITCDVVPLPVVHSFFDHITKIF